MKKYTLQDTTDPHIKRVVDREGEWEHYYHVPTKKFLRGVTTVLDRGFAKGIGFYEALKRATPDEWDKKFHEAGDRGDAVHQLIERALATGMLERDVKVLADDNVTERAVSNKEWDCLLSFQEFWNRHRAILIAKEQTVAHVEYGYAGTLDAIIILTACCGVRYCPCKEFIGKRLLIDWKSGSGIYDQHGAQVAAYWRAITERMNIAFTAILRVGTAHKSTGGYEFKPFTLAETLSNLCHFKSALDIAGIGYKPFDPDLLTEDIPDQIILIKTVSENTIPLVTVEQVKAAVNIIKEFKPKPKSRTHKPKNKSVKK